MTTVLDKALKRQVSVDGVDYTVALDPEGSGSPRRARRPEVELRWRELLSGEAAMAVALNASLSLRPVAARPQLEPSPGKAGTPAPKKRAGGPRR